MSSKGTSRIVRASIEGLGAFDGSSSTVVPARANRSINRISVSNSPLKSVTASPEPQDSAILYSNGIYQGYLQLRINKTGESKRVYASLSGNSFVCFQEDPSICMRDKKEIVTLLSVSLIGSTLVKPTVSNPNSFAIKPTVGSVTEFISPSFASKLEWSKVLQKHSSASVIDINMQRLSSPVPRNRHRTEKAADYTDNRRQSAAAQASLTAAATTADIQVENRSDKPLGMFSIDQLRDLQSAISPRQIRESHVSPIGGARSMSPQQHHHTRSSPEHYRERDWNSNFTASSKYSSKKYYNSTPKRSKEVRSNSPVSTRCNSEHESIQPASNQLINNENMKIALIDAMYELFNFDSPTATRAHNRKYSDAENDNSETEQYDYPLHDGSNKKFDLMNESEHYYPNITNNHEKSVPANHAKRHPSTASNGRRSKSAPPAGVKRKESTFGTPNSNAKRSSGTFGGSGGRRYDWVVQNIDKDARKHIADPGSQDKKGNLNRIIHKVKSHSTTKDIPSQSYPLSGMQNQPGYGNYYRNDVDRVITDFTSESLENKPDNSDNRQLTNRGGGTLESGLRQFILRDVSEAAELTRLQHWLKSINRDHYIDIFMRGGVTKMSIIELLRGDDLISIGIDLNDIPYVLTSIRKFSDATWAFTVQELLKKNTVSDRKVIVSEAANSVVTRVKEIATLDENAIHEKSKELCWLLDCGNYELFFRVWFDVIVPSITFVNEKKSTSDIDIRHRYLMRRTIEFYLHLYFIVYTIKNIQSDSLVQSHISFYKKAMDEFLQEKPTLSLLCTKEFTIAIAITMVPSPANNSAYSYFFSPPWSSAVKNMLSHYLFDCYDTNNMTIYLAQVQVEHMIPISKQDSLPIIKSDNVTDNDKGSTNKAQERTPATIIHDRELYDRSGDSTPPRQFSSLKQNNSLSSVFNSNTIQEVLSSGGSTPTRVPSFRSNRTTQILLNESADKTKSAHCELFNELTNDKTKSANRESFNSAYDENEQFYVEPGLLNAMNELQFTESRRSIHIVSAEKEDAEVVYDAVFGV